MAEADALDEQKQQELLVHYQHQALSQILAIVRPYFQPMGVEAKKRLVVINHNAQTIKVSMSVDRGVPAFHIMSRVVSTENEPEGTVEIVGGGEHIFEVG